MALSLSYIYIISYFLKNVKTDFLIAVKVIKVFEHFINHHFGYKVNVRMSLIIGIYFNQFIGVGAKRLAS